MNTDYRPTNSWDFRLRAAKLGELVSVRSLAALSLTVALIALLATLATLLAPPCRHRQPLRSRSPTTGVSSLTAWAPATSSGWCSSPQRRPTLRPPTSRTTTTFIQNLVAAGHDDIQDYSAGFRVVGCTAAVDARDNTGTNTNTDGTGVPIYWLNGNKAADDNADFYDGSWDDRGKRQGRVRQQRPYYQWSHRRLFHRLRTQRHGGVRDIKHFEGARRD